MKTIKQVADELGVSKTSVRKKLTELGLHSSLRKNGNLFAMEVSTENAVKSAFVKKRPQTKPQTETETQPQTDFGQVSALISMLQSELDIKNEQIKDLNNRLSEYSEQLSECQKALINQQTLNAVSEKKILALEDKRKGWKFWKKSD